MDCQDQFVPTARRKQLVLVAAILGSGVALLDGTIVNVALPAIDKEGHVVGVLVAGGGENINFAIPIRLVCAKLRRC